MSSVDGAGSVFKNVNPENCPITCCSITKPGCVNAYEGSEVILTGSAPDYFLTMIFTTALTEEICLEC